ncbi:transmembrane protein 272-like isoform X2 [Lissotriton helveticus]
MAETSNKSSFPPLLSNLKEKKMFQGMPVSGTVITAMMSIASITVGSVYFHDCPAQYLIPYYLIISGVSSLLLLIPSILPCRTREEPSILINVFHSVFGLFLLAFFIAGNVWIYSIYAPNYTDTAAATYCHKGLYLYAFWITTLVYIFLGLFVIGCGMFLCACCLSSRASSEVPE